ncbi:MAG: TolC family protein [Deltaproteobacteria bacterium]|nr:TolC family protein [Deltaproteobacteria bacterium]
MATQRSSTRSYLHLAGRLVSIVGLVLVLEGPARAENPQVFRPTAELGLDDLQRIVDAGAAPLEAATLEVELARADVRQAKLLPDPVLDLGYGTIPIGATNPRDLRRPLASVPNYGVGLSFTVPAGRRRPAVRRAQALVRAHDAERDALRRDLALSLAGVLGELATASVRLDGLAQLRESSVRQVEAARRRVELSFGIGLDLERLRLDLSRTDRLLLAAQAQLADARARCAHHIGRPCEGFDDGAQARAYLERWIAAPAPTLDQLPARPDLRALSAYADAARAAERLARRRRIPEPTLRLGYLHDRFVIAGNQRNSLGISLSFALPLFDRRQVQRDAATAAIHRTERERERRIATAEAERPALLERIRNERERGVRLRSEALVSAREIVAQLELAVDKRMTPMQDLLSARRVLQELVLEEAEAYADAYDAQLALLRVSPPPIGAKP